MMGLSMYHENLVKSIYAVTFIGTAFLLIYMYIYGAVLLHLYIVC